MAVESRQATTAHAPRISPAPRTPTSAKSRAASPGRLEIASRTVLATLVAFLLANAVAVIVTSFGGMEGRAAQSFAGLLAFPAFGAAAVASFTIASHARAWAVVGGLACLCTIAALAVTA